jgi:chemotaxis-related protein WspB
MLFLLMQLDGDRYALDIRQVAKVLPLVDMRPLPHAPASVAGILNYGGAPVPVVDLSQLLLNRAAHRRLNTRIVLVHYPGRDDSNHLLGLVAERAMEAVRREPTEFRASGITTDHPSQVGPVALDGAGAIHRIDLTRLLPEKLRDSLFQEPAES